MPFYFYPIKDVFNTIQKKINDSVVTNVLDALDANDDKIVYIDEDNRQTTQANSTVGEQRGVSYGTGDKTFVSVEDARIPNQTRSYAVLSEQPFFYDRKHVVVARPESARHEVTISLRRRMPSRARAQAWYNDIARRIELGGSTLVTQANFYYEIPYEVLNIIKASYDTQFAYVEPAPMSLKDYFRQCFSSNVATAKTLSGKSPKFVVKNEQTGVQGVFTLSSPKEERSNREFNWEVKLDFRYTFDCPEQVGVHYPIILNNTLVPEELWVANIAPGLTTTKGRNRTLLQEAYKGLLDTSERVQLPFIIPPCDMPDLSIPLLKSRSFTYGIFHLEMEPNEEAPTLLFNFDEIIDGNGFTVSTLLRNYIKLSYSEDQTGTDSIFKLYVFVNENIAAPGRIIIDGDLNVWYDGIIGREFIYRVLVAINMDWQTISDTAFDFLRQCPEITVGLINDWIDDPKKTIEITQYDGSVLDASELDRAIENMPSRTTESSLYKPSGINVTYGTIVSRRRT